jgi:hypothetical protein
MKFFSVVAVAASIVSQDGLITAKPLRTIDVYEISTLGGMTFKINQIANSKYSGIRKGPLAIAKAYRKYGIEFGDDLTSIIEQLLEELGLAGSSKTNTTNSASPQGT